MGVFLYIPNLIGYGRIVLFVLSCYFMPTHCGITAVCYFLSQFLDAFDGYAARVFNQSTQFGAMLDMLTDRASTLALVACLCTFYPRYMFVLQMSMVIDIVAHWLHMFTSTLCGTSHKSISLEKNIILHYYYTSRPFLFFMCGANECFYLSLYVAHFNVGPVVPVFGCNLFMFLAVCLLPLALLKSLISVVHLVSASQNLADLDQKRD